MKFFEDGPDTIADLNAQTIVSTLAVAHHLKIKNVISKCGDIMRMNINEALSWKLSWSFNIQRLFTEENFDISYR